MSKMTLLEMTQSVLNAMDSDDVNSIDDTVESVQVALTIKESYFDLISQRDWPFLRTSFQLEGLGDTSRRTYMMLNEDLSKIGWIKYNKKDVTYLSPKEFTDLIDSRTELANVVDSNGYGLNVDPTYYTTFDDVYFIFDSIDLASDTTLQSSKIQCYGTIVPTWTHEDSFIPNMPAKMFSMFLAEAKSTCFVNLKQQANPNEERKAQLGRNIMQNDAWRDSASEARWNGSVAYGR